MLPLMEDKILVLKDEVQVCSSFMMLCLSILKLGLRVQNPLQCWCMFFFGGGGVFFCLIYNVGTKESLCYKNTT